MKPILRIIFAAAAALILTACAPKINADKLEKSEYADLSDSVITMIIKEETVTTKTESLTIEYTNATDAEYVFGKEPHLEIANDDAWYVIPVKDNAAWEAIGIILPANGTIEEDFSLKYFYDGLIPGHYRVIKTFSADGSSVAAAVEFDISESVH